jgi:hypothetical protein
MKIDRRTRLGRRRAPTLRLGLLLVTRRLVDRLSGLVAIVITRGARRQRKNLIVGNDLPDGGENLLHGRLMGTLFGGL